MVPRRYADNGGRQGGQPGDCLRGPVPQITKWYKKTLFARVKEQEYIVQRPGQYAKAVEVNSHPAGLHCGIAFGCASLDMLLESSEPGCFLNSRTEVFYCLR
jgi:hypothetical protein